MKTLTQPLRRDPIKELPLRQAGESLQQEIDDKFDLHIAPYLVTVAFVALYAAFEWLRWLTGFQPHPLVITIAGLGFVAIAAWNIRKTKRTLRNYRQGLKGERYVGQLLQSTLIPKGYLIIHDVCFDGFNVDHVAIGPGGVFAFEVKTRSKTHGYRVDFDGQQVMFDSRYSTREPIDQAIAAAKKIGSVLEERTGSRVNVRPVVVYPGWFTTGSSGKDVWVLNENAVPKFIDKEQAILSPQKITSLHAGLARFVRDELQSKGLV